MGMTMAEKVLARASGRASLGAGEYVTARADRVMAHEAFTLCALQLVKLGVRSLFDPERVIVLLDHYFPAPDIAGRNVINPSATLLSAGLMLDYLGFEEAASRLVGAIRAVYAEAARLTPDQGGSASTTEFCAAVEAHLDGRQP